MQSIYTCKTISEVGNLVKEQPTPKIFFKVFLELGMKPLLSYLAFDRVSIKELLSDKNQQYVDRNYPLFYKNPDQRSAIDLALDLNQIESVNLMIKYICKYQNDAVFAHLFQFNLVDLLQKEVMCTELFESKILNMDLEFTEWQVSSVDVDQTFVPYNRSMFKLRNEF